MDLYYDFLFVYDWSCYWDYVEQTLGLFANVPKPPKRICWSPDAFQRWIEWAKDYGKKEQDGRILPLGATFDDEDDYYDFYS